jgi:2-desacetyl-2-hydroxyethyl bacteriochlorophyllide A dehydrogenase
VRDRLVGAVDRSVDRALRATGTPAADIDLARKDLYEWARQRLRALRVRAGLVGGVEAVVEAPGRVRLRPVERLLAGAGQVTVEVLASAVSTGTERAQWLRLPNARPDFPYRPGYSGAGRVLEAGAGVASVRPGDLVGIARLPHTSVVTVPAEWVFPVPDGVSVPAAALTYLAIISGYGVDRGAVEPGHRVCVLGAGVIGALAQRLAATAQPTHITVVARTRHHEDAARANGAHEFRISGDGLADVEADVVIEATGDPQALVTAIECAAPGGRVVLLGSPRGTTRGLPLGQAQTKGLTLVGAHISSLAVAARGLDHDPFRELAGRYLDAVAAGAIAVDDVAGEPTDPRELARTYDRLGRGELSAAYLDWGALDQEARAFRRRLWARPLVAASRPVVAAPALPANRRSRPVLRMAVVGCGDIGLANARAVAGAGGVELSLCVDIDPALAAAAAQWGGRATTSLDEAFDRDIVDAVILCVPHDAHVSMAVRAAESGLHVIVEKPLATDLAGAQRAVAAAAAAGVAITTCYPYRYEPNVLAARAAVDAGALGALRGASVIFHADKPEAYWRGGFSGRSASGWRLERARAGGGVLIMNLPHYVDLLRLVGGVEVERVTACARYDAGAEIEDGIAIVAELTGGAVATIVASASTPGAPPNRFELWGDDGTICLEPVPEAYTKRAVAGMAPGQWHELPPSDPDTRAAFVERFAVAIHEGADPDVTVADSLAVQGFIEAAYRSVAQGRPVSLAELDGRDCVEGNGGR